LLGAGRERGSVGWGEKSSTRGVKKLTWGEKWVKGQRLWDKKKVVGENWALLGRRREEGETQLKKSCNN